MKEIISRVIKFSGHFSQDYLKHLAKYCGKQKALLVSCVDARVVPSRFLNLEAGEAFVTRNAGNFVTSPSKEGQSYSGKDSIPGILQLACLIADVREVIVCGHSDCRAMNLLAQLGDAESNSGSPNLVLGSKEMATLNPLGHWVWTNGAQSYEMLKKESSILKFSCPANPKKDSWHLDMDKIKSLPLIDRLSQINVLKQMSNITAYPFLQDKLRQRKLHVHGMWFCVHSAQVHMYSPKSRAFVPINQDTLQSLLDELEE